MFVHNEHFPPYLFKTGLKMTTETTNLLITKALAKALMKRGVISKEEILAELTTFKSIELLEPLPFSVIQKAESIINQL
jgi:hypothetical protein